MARLYGHRDARWSPKARSNGSKCSATWIFVLPMSLYCLAVLQGQRPGKMGPSEIGISTAIGLAVGRWRCHASHPAMDVLTFLLLLETDMDWWTDDFYLVIMGDHFWPRRHSSRRCGDFHGTLAARAARLEVIRWFPFNGFDVTHRWSYQDLPEPSHVHLGSPFAADAAGCVPWARRAVANCPGEFELWWGLPSAGSFLALEPGSHSVHLCYFIFILHTRNNFIHWLKLACIRLHTWSKIWSKDYCKDVERGLAVSQNIHREFWTRVASCGILWHLVALVQGARSWRCWGSVFGALNVTWFSGYMAPNIIKMGHWENIQSRIVYSDRLTLRTSNCFSKMFDQTLRTPSNFSKKGSKCKSASIYRLQFWMQKTSQCQECQGQHDRLSDLRFNGAQLEDAGRKSAAEGLDESGWLLKPGTNDRSLKLTSRHTPHHPFWFSAPFPCLFHLSSTLFPSGFSLQSW